ncbi:YadA-like family protein [Candidatus Mycalebacterium sp.]
MSDKKVSRVGAVAIAISATPTVVSPGKWVAMGIGTGYLEEQFAVSLGMAVAVKDLFHLNLSGGFASEISTVSLGGTVRF